MGLVTWDVEADLDGDGVPETSLLPYVQKPGRGIRISRTHAHGTEPQASRMQVDLSNRGGEFAPRNLSATLGRKLRTGTIVRTVATHNSTDYTKWTGYLKNVKRRKGKGTEPQIAQLDCYSRFGFFRNADLVHVGLSSARDVDGAISAVAEEAGMTPADDLDLWDSIQDLEWHFAAGQNPLDGFIDAATSELGGQLYELADNRIAFESRDARVGMSQYQREVRKDNPLAYWRLSERTGTVANDFSRNGRNGAYTGSPTLGAATLLGVPDGLSVDLEASSGQYVDLTPHASWATSQITVEAIFRAESLANTAAIMDYRTSGNVGGFSLEWNGGTSLTMYVYISGSWYGAGLGGFLTSTNYYICGRYDGAKVKILVVALEGSEVGIEYTYELTQAGAMADPGGTADATIGGRVATPGDTFDGRMQEVAYYGAALSDARVKAHWQAALGTRFKWGDGTNIKPVEWEEQVDEKDLLTAFEVRGSNFLEGQEQQVLFRFSGNMFNLADDNGVLALTTGQVYTRRFQAKSVYTLLVTPLTAHVDYKANDSSDGSGTDRTSSLGVSVNDLGDGWIEITLTNNHSGTIHVTHFQIRGTPLEFFADRAVARVEKTIPGRFASAKSAQADIPFVNGDSLKLLAYAMSELRIGRYPIERLLLEFMPDHDDEREAMLALEIGDIIHYTDVALGTAKGAYVDETYYVVGIDDILPIGRADKTWPCSVELVPTFNWRDIDKIAHDDFNRADASGDLGTARCGTVWATDTGWDISSNTAIPNTNNPAIATLDLGALAFDQVVEVSLSGLVGTDVKAGIAFGYIDANNHYRAYVDRASTGTLYLTKMVAGVETTITSVAWVEAAAAEIRVIKQNERIRVWLNGILEIDADDTAHNTGTKIGLYAANALAEAVFDDIYGCRT